MQELNILYAALREAIRAGRFDEALIIQAGAIRLHAMAPDLPTEKQPAVCAWCLDEMGLPHGNGSHGICPRHAAAMTAQSQARKAARLANVA